MRISDFASPSLVGHILFGGLFCVPWGLSFAALRISTLTLSLGALLLLYRLLRGLDVPPDRSALAALVLWANPIYLLLSFTFMTDVPFIFWVLLSLVFFQEALRRDREDLLLWASAVAGIAFLVRQLGLGLPFGMVLYLGIERRLNLRRALRLLAPAVVIAGLYVLWFYFYHGPTWAHRRYNILGTLEHLSHPLALVHSVALDIWVGLILTGLFASPIVAASAVGGFCSEHHAEIRPFMASLRRSWKVVFLLLVFFAILFALFGMLPYSRGTAGILSRYGLGTVVLLGFEYKCAGIFAKTWFWFLGTVVGALSATYLAVQLKEKGPQSPRLL
ncbi:MAG: glycosyltransferase family 39 protein, partial [Elusimicrobia bacterium]|nr:glycosyltransferase family 39 protein [Elusimicrobiota bacterium]